MYLLGHKYILDEMQFAQFVKYAYDNFRYYAVNVKLGTPIMFECLMK